MRFSLLILPSMSFLYFPFNKTKVQRSKLSLWSLSKLDINSKLVPMSSILFSIFCLCWFKTLAASGGGGRSGSDPHTVRARRDWRKRHYCRLVCCFCSVAKLCPTLCDPVNCSPPGSSVHGIFQARILKWVTIYFSRESSWPRNTNPCLLHWQKDSLPLNHQGSHLYLTNPYTHPTWVPDPKGWVFS